MSAWDRLMRHWGEVVDRAVLGTQPTGIYSALPPITIETAPPVTVADIDRVMRQIDEARSYRDGPHWREFRCGSDVPSQLTAGLPMAPADPSGMSSISGVRMVVDETLATDEWRLVGVDGRVVLHRGGTIYELPPSPSRTFMQPPDDFSRFERIACEGAADGDILGRIDSAVESWELRWDAYRHRPQDTPERGDLTK